MSFPAYDEYQATGIEWFPKVPSEWTVTKLGRLLDELPCYGVLVPDSDDDGMPMLRITDMENGNANRDSLNKISQALSDQYSRTLVEVGDVVLSVVGTIGVAFKVDADLAGVNLSRAVARIQVGDALHAEYLCWIFQSIQFRRYVDLICTGTAQRVLNMGDLTAFSVAAPDVDEQKAISSFLDVETSKIDGLVSEQRRLIELLKEKRQAVISHAVTKGLNPNAPMKPSGIQWLGDVPQHWEVIKLKRLGSIRYGIGEPPKYHDEGTPLIRATNVRSGVLTPIGLVFVNPDEIPEQRIVWLETGDIIVVRSGAGTGDSAIMPCDYGSAIAGFDMVLRLTHANAWFIQFVLLSKYVKEGQIDVEKTRAAQPHLNAEELGNCDVVLPPEDEQVAIVEYLVDQTQRFDTLQAEAERAIELLQERRTALISAAVTGKIDVREFTLQETA